MDFIKKNVAWVLGGLILLNVMAFVAFQVAVDKAADKVLETLKKEYSPSPYGPGFDPDKVTAESINGTQKFFELRSHKVELDQEITDDVRESDIWRNDWETVRMPN